MDIGSLLIAGSLAALIGAFVARPIFERSGLRTARADPRLSGLLAERERILSALYELDMDFTMGKLVEEDYQPERAALLQQGAAVLRQIDESIEAGGVRPPEGGLSSDVDELERLVEAEVARLRRGSRPPEMENRFCAHCGVQVYPGDQFCTRCGEPLLEQEHAG